MHYAFCSLLAIACAEVLKSHITPVNLTTEVDKSHVTNVNLTTEVVKPHVTTVNLATQILDSLPNHGDSRGKVSPQENNVRKGYRASQQSLDGTQVRRGGHKLSEISATVDAQGSLRMSSHDVGAPVRNVNFPDSADDRRKSATERIGNGNAAALPRRQTTPRAFFAESVIADMMIRSAPFSDPADDTSNTADSMMRSTKLAGSTDVKIERFEHVPVVTVETRVEGESFTISGVPKLQVVNLGGGQKWGGVRTKVSLYSKWFEQSAKEDPDQVVVALDADMLFAGCSEAELLRQYRAIVEASGGAPVVAGGDCTNFPRNDSVAARFRKLEPRRQAILRASGDPADHCGTRTYRFLNSGFVMGPARELQKIYRSDTMLNYTNAAKEYHDQGALTQYMLEHPDQVTIDHAMLLVASLSHFVNASFLEVEDDHIQNMAAQKTQCFIHGNGVHGKILLAWLQIRIAAHQGEWTKLPSHFLEFVQATVRYSMKHSKPEKFFFKYLYYKEVVFSLIIIIFIVMVYSTVFSPKVRVFTRLFGQQPGLN